MRAKFYLIILSVLASFMSHSQSLVAGDIAFVGYNTDAGPVAGQDHSFSFIALTDIPAGEIIYFTEEGWNDVSNTWAGTDEGHAQWTAPAGGVSCGTVVFVTESGADVFTVSSGTISLVSGIAGWNLTGGDQVLAYYAATPEPATTPTFISGVNGDDGNGSPVSFNSTTQWNDPATGPLGTAKSGLPAGLTNGVNCVSLFVTTFTEMDNAKYTGTLTGTSTALRAAINDRTNWTFDDVNAFDISPAGYSPSVTCVAPCTEPTIPTITASSNPICVGQSTTLNISGNLNDATQWHVYTGFCGVTPVGVTAGSTFVVSPTSTTSYFIRGEGGCATPGTCGAISITVNPLDNASFNYSASAFCTNAADPTPTISGQPGGTFSSTAGLSLNASTGSIDVSASTPGTYTVTYTTSGSCPNSSNVSVTINALDNASFAYGGSAFCTNASDPTPIITGLAGGTFSSTAGLSLNASTGTIDVSASTPGTYTVTYTTAGTCPNASNVSVTINALANASFNYSASAFCTNGADPTPTISGQPGGTFSSTAGLSLNASTGSIDVSASTPGTYTVTYTTGGTCPNSSNVSVTINALDNASFAYGGSTFCGNGSDPTPIITGLAGGTFSSTAGLSLNASTGIIDVSASTPGTYTVTYTTAGTCPNASNVSVTINAPANASFNYNASAFCTNAADPTPTISGQPGGTFSSTAGLSLNASTGTIDVSASTPGTYTVTYATGGTCPNSSNVSVTINALDNASFSYGGSTFCGNGSDPTPIITGLAGGTFSSTAGLSLNASTGTIDVSASTPGSYTVTYTTAGSCPNSSNVSVTINAADNASFSYSAGSYCVAETDPTPIITGLAGGTFSSAAGLSLNASTGTIDVSASTPGSYTVTYTTNGTCPNSASVSVTITALDDASFSYSASSFCSNGTNPSPTVTGVAGGTFSSTAGLVFVSTATGEIDLVASTPGTYTVTYTTSGACANSATQNVTVSTPPVAPSVVTPVVVCPGGDVILSATGSGTGNIVFYDGTMTQLFSGAMPPATVTTNLGVLANGTYFFTATEDNGGCESAPTTIEVFVGDTTDPVAVCQNITVFLDGSGMATITASDLDGGSTDNCGPVTVAASQTSFDCSDINGSATGTLILTGVYDAGLTGGLPKGVELYVANDIADLSQYGLGSANNGGGTDGQEFTFPATSVTAGTYIYVASEAPQFTSFFGFAPDYTDGSMGINGDDAIELFHMGSVIDVFGDINVDGTGQPWDYEDGWAYRNNGTGPDGSAFGLGNWTYSGLDAFTGAATNAAATPVMPIGTFMPASSGSTPVVLTVTDGVGNTATCSANVIVVDTIAPTISCNSGVQNVSEDGTGDCTFTPFAVGQAGSYDIGDNCSSVLTVQEVFTGALTATSTWSLAPGAGYTPVQAFPVGVTNVTVTVTDESGNTATCSYTTTIIDDEAPTAVCQNITVFLDGAGNATMTAAELDGGSTDNCGAVTLSASQSAFTCADIGTNSVTLTVTDGNANVASCTAIVTVADTVSPVVVCPGDQTETASATCDFILPDYTGLVTTSDNCGAVTVTQSPIPGTVITSDQVITMTGVDPNGNVSTCTFNVLLTGATPPTAVCQNITVYLDGSGNASITASDIDGGSTATCGGLTLSASVTSFTCADLGANNVTLTATDGGGNTDDCIAVVTVVDTITPVPDAASLPEVIAECEVTSLTDPTALDNCGAVTVTNDATFPISTQGSTTITWTFDDGNGNTATQTQVVTIIDSNSPLPTAAPLPDVVGQCSVDALPAAPTAIDACAGPITGVLITPITFPVTTQGTTVIVWQFDDGNGNISTQSQNIIVNDITGPVPNTTTLPALTGDCSIDMPTAPTATDNCAGAITGTTSTVFPITAIGTTTIVWEFNDGNGNFTTQTQLATNSGIDASATLESDGVTITANASGGTYAWLNCDFNTVIAGETGQSFTPAANGVYAAIVTLGNCTDTSACITVSSVGVNDLSIDKLSVYPNPSLDGFFTVNFEGNIEAIDVVDMLGRTMVLPTDVSTGVVDGSELAQGRYMVRVLTEGTIITTEIVIVK